MLIKSGNPNCDYATGFIACEIVLLVFNVIVLAAMSANGVADYD